MIPYLLNNHQMRHFTRGWHGVSYLGNSVGFPELEDGSL